MSYLLDFVKTFDAAEQLQFRQMDVIGKEELLRDAYANNAQQKKFDETLLPKKFHLSVSHFDKLNSVLLDKTVQQFYGNDYMKCLTSLVKRGLTQLMLHELKIIERRIITAGNKNEVLLFYAAAFEALCSMFHPHYDAKKAEAYGKKYLQTLGKKSTVADEVFVAMRSHQSTMVAQAMAGNEETYRAEARKVIEQWEKKLKNTTNKQALFHLHFTEAGFVKFYGSDVTPFLEAMEKCKTLLPKLGGDLQREYSFRVYCELSFGYIEAENYMEAEQNFEVAFALPYVNSARQSYQSGNYLNVCLINKNYKQAKFIFKNQLEYFLGENINKSVRFDVLLNALMLHLHIQQFEKAYTYLQQMLTYKRNEITLMGQINIRVGETLYFYCFGDYKMAAVLAKRNIRFMNRPENRNPQFDYQLQLMNCLLQFSRQKEKGLEPTQDVFQQKQQLRGSMFNVFNQLL